VTRASAATMPRLSMVEKCDRRAGEWAHGTVESISAPHTTANAASTATAQSESIIEPGSARVSSRVTAPLSHSTPLTRPASATSPGLASRSPPQAAVNSRNRCNETSSSSRRGYPLES
jgi:hypothetical protein